MRAGAIANGEACRHQMDTIIKMRNFSLTLRATPSGHLCAYSQQV